MLYHIELIRTSFFVVGVGGLFLLVKGYFASCCIANQGLAMRFEEGDGIGGRSEALL